MGETKTLEITKVREVPKTAEEVNEESQVIVHCSYMSEYFGSGIRIWPSTFLFDHDSDHRSSLLFAENITKYPDWTYLYFGQSLRFTLIFKGLPKSCTAFDLAEVIPEPGGFQVRNIRRNGTDVYEVKLR